MSGSLTVNATAAAPVTVNITRKNGTKTVTPYTDATYATSITLPDTISATKTYWFNDEDTYVLSAVINGVECANTPDGTRDFTTYASQSLGVSPSYDGPVVGAGALLESVAMSTYSAVARTGYNVTNDRILWGPNALAFSPQFVPLPDPGTHYGQIILKTGSYYEVYSVYGSGDLGHVALAEPVFSVASDNVYDPWLMTLPSGNLFMACHSGNEGRIYNFLSTDKGATWTQKHYFDPGVQSTTHQRFSEAMVIRVPLGQPYTGASTRLVMAWADIDPYLPALGINETQTITITGSPTGGTFTLTFGGQTTTALAYNANAAAIQAALQALTSIGAGNITVTGTSPNFTATFGGTLAHTAEALITATSSLTGGTSPGISIVETLRGRGDTVIRTAYSNDEGATWSASSVVTPTSGANSAGILNDSTRPWIWMNDAGNINLVFSRVDNTTGATSIQQAVLSGDGSTVVTAAAHVVDTPLMTQPAVGGTNSMNGVSPCSFVGRDGNYYLVWGESSWATGGTNGTVYMMQGDGTPAGWTNKVALVSRTDCGHGYGRTTPHRLFSNAVDLLIIHVNGATTTTFRQLTLSGL